MRGELFWAEVVHDDGAVKRRPVLELSAPELRSPIVVPVTSTVRGLPSEVPIELGSVSGVLNTIAAGPIRRENLTASIGLVPDGVMGQVCRAMAWTTGCRVQ
ncbi:MAG: type II toxin-antitoxin system PemK/MazF family toxin [Actinomycetota bacterium]